MNNQVKEYINKLFSYVPVAITVFTIVFFISITASLEDIQADFGADALELVMGYFRFYFFRTILFVLVVPLYDFILVSKRFSLIWSKIIHGLVINLTVAIMFYRIGDSSISILIILAMCTVIYISIQLIILLREKQFINDANKIFKNNQVEDEVI